MSLPKALRYFLHALLVTSVFTALSAKADKIRYVAHSEKGLASFLDLIQNAKKSIALTTFIFEPCHASTQVVMDAMIAKAKAGVHVRILLDEFMQSREQVAYLNFYLQSHGIDIRWYNTSLANLNFRSHIKLMVADGEKYITGGRNIADDYFSLYYGPNFIDRDAYVEGDSAQEAQQVFETMWNSKWAALAKTKKKVLVWADVCEYDEASRVAAIKSHMKEHRQALVASLPQRTCNNTHFIADEPGAKILYLHKDGVAAAEKEKKHTTAEFLKFIRGTKKKIILENWSLMPHHLMGYELFDLRWKKIPVVVITNDNMDGPGILKYAEDSYGNRSARHQDKGSVMVQQVSMNGALHDDWKLTPEDTQYRLHGKVSVRDNKDVMISSFNMDNRSYSLNMESMVLVKDCPALAQDLNEGFADLLETYHKDIKAGVPRNDKDNLLWAILGALGSSFF